ncbi:flagellar brake domain-containing protein [Cupriavidus metallidurans]|uniref:Flagellar brake protein n=1 Tax=Cupriavidus metallidurans TaxID=119219 RepID=A0A482IZ49_9BURK|nr:flagellar brake protein [Cupriavidus metallidurans]QBP12489.1 flagellar brake protein [Cupriavidus metallidurans]
MRREILANEIELGQPLKSALVDELGFPVADEGTVFQTGDEVALVLQAGRCFWADDMAPLRPDEPSPPWAGGYGLLVGTLLHVKRPGDLERAWVSRLIGCNDDAVFVAWPGLAGTSAEPCDGDLVLVRGFTGTSIHSFSARVRATSRTPFPYWMLTDISHVDAREMRGSIRVPVRLVGRMSRVDGADAPQTVLITDLSTGGVSVSTANDALTAPGLQVRLAFTLRTGGIKSAFSLEGWTRQDPNAGAAAPYHSVGVAFDGYGEREALLLRSFVHEQLLESATMRPAKLAKD